MKYHALVFRGPHLVLAMILELYVVVVVVLTLTRIVKSVVTGVEYPRKKNTNQKWYTHMIPKLTQFMPPQEKYKN